MQEIVNLLENWVMDNDSCGRWTIERCSRGLRLALYHTLTRKKCEFVGQTLPTIEEVNSGICFVAERVR